MLIATPCLRCFQLPPAPPFFDADITLFYIPTKQEANAPLPPYAMLIRFSPRCLPLPPCQMLAAFFDFAFSPSFATDYCRGTRRLIFSDFRCTGFSPPPAAFFFRSFISLPTVAAPMPGADADRCFIFAAFVSRPLYDAATDLISPFATSAPVAPPSLFAAAATYAAAAFSSCHAIAVSRDTSAISMMPLSFSSLRHACRYFSTLIDFAHARFFAFAPLIAFHPASFADIFPSHDISAMITPCCRHFRPPS